MSRSEKVVANPQHFIQPGSSTADSLRQRMAENQTRIIIVDDDPIVARSIAEYLNELGYGADCAHSGERALETIDDVARLALKGKGHPFSVAVIDMTMPGMSGLELIKRLRRTHPDIVPIVITGYGTIESAVKSIRYGAIDYLTKPLVDNELRIAVEKAVRQQALLAENQSLRKQLDGKYALDNIIGSDPRMARLYETIQAVAPSRTTVLMSGESGTGKSLIARAIHRNSPRKDKPFVEISCGSIPETLLESELFGHVKGAFTGAHADKVGRFLAAHGGTLFLDEINSASPGMQLKLLRVLQEKTFEPVGSTQPVEVDVRVILASNQPLERLVAEGEFRQDLYYRINVVMIELPPLRDRLSDIPSLAQHFLTMKSAEAGKQIIGFTDDTMNALRDYRWPGNVRELENIVERAVVLTKSTRITPEDLPAHVLNPTVGGQSPGIAMPWPSAANQHDWQPIPLRVALEEPEKQIILAALEANRWNRQKTAEQLDINRTTLYKKIKQYGLEQYSRTG